MTTIIKATYSKHKILPMKTILTTIFLLIVLAPFFVSAQTTPVNDSLLNRMAGKWVLSGTIGGQETTHDITVEWVLGHQYVEMKEVSREKTNGKPSYEALVYITLEQPANQYACLWLDNTGNGGLSAQAIGRAKPNGDKLEFLFKGSDGSNFHTTFIYDRTTDTWQWQMDSEENGKLLPFARVKLTRK
jgi:hypothetical protein